MSRKKGTEDPKNRELELKYHQRLKIIDSATALCQSTIRFGAFVVVSYFVYHAVLALAGKATFADIGVRVLGDIRISETFAWGAGATGVFYGLRQRKLRRDKTDYLQGRIRKLETDLDPGRSSSRLTTRGTTNPRDTE